MGLLEIFRPKWKHQDPSIRISAIKKMGDVRTLNRIYSSDKNQNVRQEALFRIIQKEKNLDTKKEMLEKIEDQALLAELAKNDNNEEIRKKAADLLDSKNWEKLMVKRAQKDLYEYIRETILRELGDQEALAEIAKNDQDNWVRFWAVAKITNQDILVKIVQDVDYHSRAAIIQKLSEDQWQDLIADLAENDSSPTVRQAAVSRLNPQKWEGLLKKISKKDIDKIRIIACGKLKHQAPLVEYLKSDSVELCRLALNHLDPGKCQEILIHIAQNHPDKSIRLKALEKLEDRRWQEVFLGILQKEKDEEIRKTAVEKLDSKKSFKLLAEIAKCEGNYDVRDAALERLDVGKCQELIADIARTSPDGYVRKRAVEKLDPLKWKDLLNEIACEDEEYIVHQAAREKLESM
jgi:hypothetical protein